MGLKPPLFLCFLYPRPLGRGFKIYLSLGALAPFLSRTQVSSIKLTAIYRQMVSKKDIAIYFIIPGFNSGE